MLEELSQIIFLIQGQKAGGSECVIYYLVIILRIDLSLIIRTV